MARTLTRQGDDLLLKIDRELLQRAGIDESTPLTITAEGNTLYVRPTSDTSDEEVDDATFTEVHAKVLMEWHDVFRKLAE